jgi:hypothetical protein
MATHWPGAGLTGAHAALQLFATPVAQQLQKLAAFTGTDANNRPKPASPKNIRIAHPPQNHQGTLA